MSQSIHKKKQRRVSGCCLLTTSLQLYSLIIHLWNGPTLSVGGVPSVSTSKVISQLRRPRCQLSKAYHIYLVKRNESQAPFIFLLVYLDSVFFFLNSPNQYTNQYKLAWLSVKKHARYLVINEKSKRAGGSAEKGSVKYH